MSTIASPRETSLPPMNRRIASNHSSARPSLDSVRSVRSAASSPAPSGLHRSVSAATSRNRAALREYYKLRKGPTASSPPSVEVTDPLGEQHEASEVPPSEMDKEGFDAEAFVKTALAEKGMADLLKLYTRTLGEIRALDAEKKALVYDNYSKLITATETIRKMRANMDPLNPMASTLDPAIAQVYSQASAIREALRQSLPPPDASSKEAEEARERKLRTKQLAFEVLETPSRIRALMNEGHLEDARQAWRLPRKLLETWKERGLGGDAVQSCIDDGDAAIRGEPSRFDWRAAETYPVE